MTADWRGLGALLTQGPVLLLCGLVVACLAGMAVIGARRRREHRGRDRVLAACEQAAARVVRVPEQRPGERAKLPGQREPS